MKKKSVSQSAFFNSRLLIGVPFLFAAVTLAFFAFRSASAQDNSPQPEIRGIYQGLSPVVHFDISPPLRDMKLIPPGPGQLRENEDRDIVPPNFHLGYEPDPVVQSKLGDMEIPPPLISFDGPSNSSGVAPPDPNGAVGPNHVVVMCNLSFQIFTKTGTSVFGPAANNTLWAGFGGHCQTENAGDPVVLYDQLADRWILSQFTAAAAPFFNCVAVSTSPDPTGTYFRYAFLTGTTGANFPDYPKYGIWPDAYYLSTREFAGAAFAGAGAYALNRAQMIAGNPAPQVISFLMPPGGTPYNVGDGLLPANLDGMTLPPAGSPEYYLGSMDNNGQYGAPQDALTLYKFTVDFATPANSTFVLANTLPTAPFNSILGLCGGTRACIPQPGTANKIDHLGYRQRPLHRLAYRNFGTHESLVTNQSVSGGTGPNGEVAGIRWWELRSPNVLPVIFQEGTFAPGVTDGVHRWMGSIAMDGQGNMGLGYSVSNNLVFPGVYYTGRLAGSPLDTMPLGENAIVSGTGSQTAGGNRWGDYTALSIDPTDDLTFWFVNEYVPTTSGVGWRLRIGSFKALPGGPTPTPFPTQGTPTPTPPPGTPTPTPGPTQTPGPTPCAASSENFDGVTAPALPAGWVAANAAGAAPLWVTSTTTPDTAPNDASIDDPASVSDKRLDTPNINITSASTQVSFRNNYALEPIGGGANFYDGAVLEVSSPNIAGGAFTDITDAAVGGSFVTGGYNGTISTAFMNPIAGRTAWSQSSGGYINTVANLGPNVNGQTIKLRFRMCSDSSVNGTGWLIDTLVVSVPCGATPTPAATATPTPTPPPTPTPTPTPAPTPSPTPTATPTATPIPAAQALNLSTRLLDGTGNDVGIGGFIITGSVPKQVLLRGIGPSLTGVGTPLADPVMELHGPSPFATITNDNWRDSQETAIIATGIPPTNNLESAILATLNPGSYTAVLKGNGTGAGVALVEIYDLDPAAASKLGNISTRAFVNTGNNIVIAGFILGNATGNDKVVIRGLGPSVGLTPPLANPKLEMRDQNGAVIISNDNWQDDPAQAGELIALGLAPTNTMESAMVTTVAPGSYTALLSGVNGTTGLGLVEVYDNL